MKKSLIKILFMCPMLTTPLALGNYAHNNNVLKTKSNDNKDKFSFAGGGDKDRYYYLILSSTTAKKMLTYAGTDWWGYLDGGGWGPGFGYTGFHNRLLGYGSSAFDEWNDEGSVHSLINGTNDHVFNGKAPDGNGYHAFNDTIFRNLLKGAVKNSNSVLLDFYCDWSIFHNKYGANWYNS